MRRLYLVGESLPDKTATPFEGQGDSLVAIDPRHGVFPNLVAKPLLTALYALHKANEDTRPLFSQLGELLCDKDENRRFNVFEKTYKERENKNGKTVRVDQFSLDAELDHRLTSFDIKKEIWAVFGVQTNFGLLGYMLGTIKKKNVYSKNQIIGFAKKFVRAALAHKPASVYLPSSIPTQRTALLGILHRLCCSKEQPDFQPVSVLRAALKTVSDNEGLGLGPANVDAIVEKLRSTVPLLHNEAYQDRYTIGYNQAHFVLCQAAKGCSDIPSLYWQVMGRAIADRLQGRYVER